MTADQSRRAILVYALLAVRAVALGTPTVLGANAEGTPPLHSGPWPIHNGRNYQPTEDELRALHLEDVTPDQAREIDRLYDQLLAGWQRKSSESVSHAQTLIALSASGHPSAFHEPAHRVRAELIDWRKCNAVCLGTMAFDRSLCFSARCRKRTSCQIATCHRSSQRSCDPKLRHSGWCADLSRRLRSGWSAYRPRRPSCLRRPIQVWRRLICGQRRTASGRVDLTVRRSFPVLPAQRTFSRSVGNSSRCLRYVR
jgi:hypothetical protein